MPEGWVRMRAVRLRPAVFVALLVMPLMGWTVPLISPAAGTDAILALRTAPSGELRLEYTKDSGSDAPAKVSAGISSDYHYLRSGDRNAIYDYKLRRIFVLQKDNSFVNNSLYAEVWYRAMELQSRVALSGALAKGGADVPAEAAASHEPFYMETDLGVTSKQLARPALQQVTEHDRVRWSYKGQEVAAVRYEKREVPQAIQGSLRRFWTSFTKIHPDIAEGLAASRRMPSELWVLERPFGKQPVMAHWKLTQSRWEAAAAYPLPPHLSAGPVITTGGFPDIFATLAAAVAEKRAPPASEVYTSRAEAAIDHGAGLEAIVWLMEMNLAQGRPYAPCTPGDTRPFCSLSVRAGPLAKNDPRVAIAFTRSAPDKSSRAQFDTLPNAYLLRLLWATRPPGKDVEAQESERDLLAALRASPIANFCKDTGDFYAQQWQAFAAWQAWDFGRLMAGHTPGDLLETIDTVESNLAAGEHALF